MLSVLIPTCNSERTLIPVLSALVPGAVEGLVREVILADGGSGDATERIADAAGCQFRQVPGEASARLKTTAIAARSEWLLIVHPAALLEESWTREAVNFIDSNVRAGTERAGAFRYAIDRHGLVSRISELAVAARLSLTGQPGAEQPLLVSRRGYLAGNIGRAVALRCRAILPG